MGHPNVHPSISRLAEGQFMYRDMRVGETISITAEDAATKQPGTVILRVVSIRPRPDGDRLDVTFQYLGDGFTFWQYEAQGTTTLEPGTLLESGISATLIPHFIERMIGVGGIGLFRDYGFDSAGGDYTKQVIIHNLQAFTSVIGENGEYAPPDLTEYFQKLAASKQQYEEAMRNDIPDRFVLPDNPRLRQKLERKLEEYRKRLDPFKHPLQLTDAHCKIAVLTRLLEHGEVVPRDMQTEVRGEPWYTDDRFRAACWVIEDYATTGGNHVSGGTGLK